MIATASFQISLALAVCVFLQIVVQGQEPASQYYKALGCNPPEPGKPTAYDCSILDSMKTDKCFYNNKSYEINDVLRGEDIGSPCMHECICQKSYVTQKANWQCVHIECPELFNPPKKNCISLYSIESCCSVDSQCSGDEPAPTVCKYNGKSYIEGQKFDADCKTCICKKGFNGTLVEPFCRPINCDFYLHYSSYIQNGCLPTYYERDDCCPIPIWRCPEESDAVLTSKTAPEESTGLKCKFGNLEMSVGQTLNPSEENKCVECSCTVPPHPTCLMNTTCYSNQ